MVGYANGDFGASMGEYTEVASAKRAVRGVLFSDEVESSVFRLSIVTVRPFLLLVDILKLRAFTWQMNALSWEVCDMMEVWMDNDYNPGQLRPVARVQRCAVGETECRGAQGITTRPAREQRRGNGRSADLR